MLKKITNRSKTEHGPQMSYNGTWNEWRVRRRDSMRQEEKEKRTIEREGGREGGKERRWQTEWKRADGWVVSQPAEKDNKIQTEAKSLSGLLQRTHFLAGKLHFALVRPVRLSSNDDLLNRFL